MDPLVVSALSILVYSPDDRSDICDQGFWPEPVTLDDLRNPSDALKQAALKYALEKHAKGETLVALDNPPGVARISHGVPIQAALNYALMHPARQLITGIVFKVEQGRFSVRVGVDDSKLPRSIASAPTYGDAEGRFLAYCDANSGIFLPHCLPLGPDATVKYERGYVSANPVEDAAFDHEAFYLREVQVLGWMRTLTRPLVPAWAVKTARERIRYCDMVGGGFMDDPGIKDSVDYAVWAVVAGVHTRAMPESLHEAVRRVVAAKAAEGVFDGVPAAFPLRKAEEQEGYYFTPECARHLDSVWFIDQPLARVRALQDAIMETIGPNAEAILDEILANMAEI